MIIDLNNVVSRASLDRFIIAEELLALLSEDDIDHVIEVMRTIIRERMVNHA